MSAINHPPEGCDGSRARFTFPVNGPARCLHQIRTVPGADRAMLKSALGFSQPSVTRHVSALIELGLVEQTSARSTPRSGRPSSTLAVDGRHLVVWGAHVGVHSTVLILADAAGRRLKERTLRLSLPELSAGDALRTIAGALTALGRDYPPPVSIGVAFSSHIDRNGNISSPVYGWEGVNVTEELSRLFGRRVDVASGAGAMAGHELNSRPLGNSDDAEPHDSTLFFYTRDVVTHAWIFDGSVHQPLTGGSPVIFEEIARSGPFTDVDNNHPLGNSSVLATARSHGVRAENFNHLVHLAQMDAGARHILNERARLLAELLILAVDVVDPDSLVFAGEAFTADPMSVRLIAQTLQERIGGPRNLRIRGATRGILGDAATMVALHRLWRDPVGVFDYEPAPALARATANAVTG